MSVECSMMAVSPERYEPLRAEPRAVADEAILRGALGTLASMSYLRPHASEAEVLAEIRGWRHMAMGEDPTMRRRMTERYAREDALVEAALARGDREPPYSLGTTWRYLNRTMADGGEPAPVERFIFSAPRLGENVGYGPAGLHDPAAVAAFAAYLDLWSPERFAAVAEARRSPEEKARASEIGMPRQLSPAVIDGKLFLNFKVYIQGAAAARAGMLIWMS
jgi:Domain of unknown function (DUF1877)